MPRIDLGNQGFAVPEFVPGPRAIPGLVPDLSGLQQSGQAVARVGAEFAERDAKLEATRLVLAGKGQLDWFRNGLEVDTVGVDGRPRYTTAPQDFDAFSSKTLNELMKQASTPLARQVLATDLASYGQQSRLRVVDIAQKQKASFLQGQVSVVIEETMATPGIDRAEREKRIATGLAGLVSAGVLAPDDAIKEQRKYSQRLEYGEKFTAVQSATTQMQLVELRGQLSQFNPLLTPEQNRDLVRLTNERISALDSQSAQERKALEESTDKGLMDKFTSGTLTLSDVQAARPSLSAEAFRRWSMQPEVMQRKALEGMDDADMFRGLQREVLSKWQDPKALDALRARIANLMTGYDPVTKQHGKPALSQDKGRELLGAVEGYIRAFRTESRTQRSEADQDKERQFRSVESLLKGVYDTEKRSRIGRSAQAEVDADMQAALGELYANRSSAGTWFEDFKKRRPELFQRKAPALPSWVDQPGGKPDFGATRDKLTEEKKRGSLKEAEYQKRMEQLRQWEVQIGR